MPASQQREAQSPESPGAASATTPHQPQKIKMLATLTTQLKIYAQATLDLLYPNCCAACYLNKPTLLPNTLCQDCFAELRPLQQPFCAKCAEPFAGELSAPFHCPNCDGNPLAMDFTICAYEMTGTLRELIHDFKYNHRQQLRLTLGWLLSHGLRDRRLEGREWMLTPVPLHYLRERERGFNQAHELARTAAQLLGLPFCAGLKRTRDTPNQAHLSRNQRLVNVKNAFRITWLARRRRTYEGKNVLVVDDVFTTGATIHECAKTLLEQGRAAKVVALTLARA